MDQLGALGDSTCQLLERRDGALIVDGLASRLPVSQAITTLDKFLISFVGKVSGCGGSRLKLQYFLEKKKKKPPGRREVERERGVAGRGLADSGMTHGHLKAVHDHREPPLPRD
ncbi:hypothetical protein E2C01_090512 [Portunus trituberculatus]|uniref:Uncharacterized protein n=1 Tax=Portunus trituberculatus TaxID=210409 RepID=A0A5B7JQJ4_PORTR|nr:hypothetical protein [Portunus trituberculatus]